MSSSWDKKELLIFDWTPSKTPTYCSIFERLKAFIALL